MNRCIRTVRSTWVAALAACLLLQLSLAAVAQPERGRGGFGIPPEELEKVWKIQSESVAGSLGLDAERTGRLVAAYRKARENLRPGGGEGRPRDGGDREAWRERLEEARKAATEGFQKDLAEFLDAEKAEKAVEALGGFQRIWDRMTLSLAGVLEGEKETLEKAVLAVNAELADLPDAFGGPPRGQRGGGGGREAFAEFREKLDEALAKILNEEQMNAWRESFQGGGFPGRGRGEGGEK